MYITFLLIHSWLRWFILLFLLARLGMSIQGWLSGRAPVAADRAVGGALIGSLHTQWLLGAILYMISPTTQMAMTDFGASMKDKLLRFWSIEHGMMMLLAIAVAHISHVVARKAANPTQGFRRAAIGNGLALILILAAIPWPGRAEIGRALFLLP